MIRVSYLLLGSGFIFYCWRLASHELAVSFQMCISIEMQPSHRGNSPQDLEWTAFLSAVSRIINDLNIGQAWPMVRVYHRFALRPVGDLGNDIYVPLAIYWPRHEVNKIGNHVCTHIQIAWDW